MVFCQECGSENIDDAKFCLNCGNEIINKNEKFKINNQTVESVHEKKENEKLERSGIKRINLLAIFGGIATWIIVIFILALSYPNETDNLTIALFFIVAQLISSIVTGYIANTSFKNGVINGGILFIIPTILFTTVEGLDGFFFGFPLFLSIGCLGGGFGFFIKKIKT